MPDSVKAIDINDLHYTFANKDHESLRSIDLALPRGSRCLLIGANGAGKSTLLTILAGKRLIRNANAKVLGREVFFDTPPGVVWLGTEWASNPVVRSDLKVEHFIDSIGGWRHKERRDRLLDLMDVDLEWHMHQVSDGERRRVQIVAGLLHEWELLLLDEVTVDLDVLVRSRLLEFLREETETRGATVLYATHIFDGLDRFPTHVCHLQLGRTVSPQLIEWPLPPNTTHDDIEPAVLTKMADPDRVGSKLLELAMAWLIQDKAKRIEFENQGVAGFNKRGRSLKETTESEIFYRKQV